MANTNGTNGAIVKHEEYDAPITFGKRDQVAAIQKRMATMMDLPPDVPQDVIWAAAQLAVMHNLDPFSGQIWIMEMGRKKDKDGNWYTVYRPMVGIKGLRVKARRQSNYQDITETMEAEEVKAHRRDLYDENDIGARCTLWRLDVARECKEVGIPYQPTVGYGFWRQKAKWSGKDRKWMPDNIPNTWSAQMVAEKRAEADAIKKAFDLDLDVTVAPDEYVADEMQWRVEREERETALPAPKPSMADNGLDENGMPLPFSESEDAEFYDVEEQPATNGNGHAPEPDNPFDDGGQYAALIDRLEGDCRKRANWVRRVEHGEESGGPCTEKMYQYLAGILNGITEAEGSHRAILEVLTGKVITHENRPCFNVASRLIDVLPEQVRDKNTGEMVENPNHQPAAVNCMRRIWELCREADGQLAMKLEAQSA